MSGLSVQIFVKTQMELVEEEYASLCPCICSLYYALIVESPSLKLIFFNLQPIKIESQDEAHPSKW